jgi:cell division protein FtsW (lipid II flippase)
MSFYIPTICIFALIVGFAGSKSLRECDWKRSILLIAYRGILPMFLLMKINVVSLAAVYTAIFIVYLCFTRRKIWQVAAFVGGCVVVALYIVTNHYYMMSRLLGFLNRTDDPTGGDYMTTRSMDAMQSAGWWEKAE